MSRVAQTRVQLLGSPSWPCCYALFQFLLSATKDTTDMTQIHIKKHIERENGALDSLEMQ